MGAKSTVFWISDIMLFEIHSDQYLDTSWLEGCRLDAWPR